MDEEISYYIKIVLTGEGGTGKTSYFKYLANFHFSSAPVNIDFTNKYYTIRDKMVRAQIWDTGSWEKFCPISSIYYRGAKAAMLFYDITDLNSFNSLKRWLDDIHKYAEPNSVIILIGSKCDSSDDERQVSIERGQNFAKQHNLLFCEISNRNHINIEESIIKLVDKTVSVLESELEER